MPAMKILDAASESPRLAFCGPFIESLVGPLKDSSMVSGVFHASEGLAIRDASPELVVREGLRASFSQMFAGAKIGGDQQ
jgi:hypothetical protein